MSTFFKTYNVAYEAGVANITGVTAEENLTRANAVKAWFDSSFGDIFESVIVVDGSYTYNYFYYKGTNSGIYIQQYTSTSNSGNQMGSLYNGATKLSKTYNYLHKSEINLLIMKSKYGVVAYFYTTTLNSSYQTMAIYNGGRLYPILLNTATANYITNGASPTSFNLTARSQTEYVVLTRFAPPNLSFIPEGIYWNSGASIGDSAVYEINGAEGQFTELPGVDGYQSVAMKLVEPDENDYKDLTGIWNTAEETSGTTETDEV